MPLVPSNMNPAVAGSAEEWSAKLVGKKLTDSSSGDVNAFSKTELPQNHRVLPPGQMATMDFKPDRLNVHVNDEGTVERVRFG
ncbi:hypothetical protein FQN54_005679 [Arachnomyces sp. PD_36]|nr:hypothetical protein FQN54_005679 [Arachnomyces sp. PD_36]